MNLNTITTAPGAAIGAETDTLPAKVAQLPGQHETESAPTAATGVITTAQRVIATFSQHGINSSLLIQLQHVQELALAINLSGRHLVHWDIFGSPLGVHRLTLAVCPRDPGWVGRQRMASRSIEIPEGGDETAMREAQSELANAAADLMALIEEDAQ